MSVFFFTTFVCLVIGLVIFLYVQYQILLNEAHGREPSAGVSLARSFPPKPKKTSATSTQWKAVRIKVGLMCCQSAERMRGQVFLISEAPEFPLLNCKSNGCQCGYVYLDDRRQGGERRDSIVAFSKWDAGQQKDRRQLKDRRTAMA